MLTNKYELHLKTVGSDRVICHHDFEVSIYHCDDQYGNGCFVDMSNEKIGYADFYLDVRYNMEFDPSDPVSFIWKFCKNRWSGKNGSNILVAFDITEVEI